MSDNASNITVGKEFFENLVAENGRCRELVGQLKGRLINKNEKLEEYNKLLSEKYRYIEVKTRLEERLSQKNKQLEELELVWRKLHANLALRYKMEKIEKISRPDDKTEAEWIATSRFDKWVRIYNNGEDYIFYNFVQSVKQYVDNADKFGRYMRHLYSILNARLHDYMESGDIVDKPFIETVLNDIGQCLSNTDVN